MNSEFRMRVKFWGVRGSIPTPQARNLTFGGNTACLELRLPNDEIVVFDGGTGIRDLGISLLEEFGERPLTLNLLLSHFHWDHIQGIPFFAPLYSAQNRVVFHADGTGKGHPERMLVGQMQAPYFPVDLARAPAAKEFVEVDASPIVLGDLVVRPFPLNHPQGATGFRVEREGAVLVYASDFEHGVKEYDLKLREFASGADLLIYDAQYTPEEYEIHQGWGHSTWREAVEVARECGVGHLVLFHHAPGHSDVRTRSIVEEARAFFRETSAAREGAVIEI